MRGFLDDLGATLDHLADLGLAVQRAFPGEVATLRGEAEASISKGDGSSFVGRAIGMAEQGRRARRDPAAAYQANALFQKMAMEVMSDPYAWLTRNQERLRTSTTSMPDGTAAILWDTDPDSERETDWKPVLAGAITMKLDGDRWYAAFPTNLLRVMPKSAEEWEIASLILQVVDNALTDLQKDVESGKAASLQDVAGMAGEKAVLPMGLALIAYDRARDARRDAARKTPSAESPAQKR
jgi:hypothetical protein